MSRQVAVYSHLPLVISSLRINLCRPMLRQRYRLRHSADIRWVYRQGRRWFHPLITLYAVKNEGDHSRFAVSAGRRIGKAVVRNRAKRLLREGIRHHLPQIEPGWDCLLVARPGLAAASYAEVEDALKTLFSQAGLMSAAIPDSDNRPSNHT